MTLTYNRISSKTTRKPDLKTFLKWLLLPVTLPLLGLLFCGGIFFTVLGEVAIDIFDRLAKFNPLPEGVIRWAREVEYA